MPPYPAYCLMIFIYGNKHITEQEPAFISPLGSLSGLKSLLEKQRCREPKPELPSSCDGLYEARRRQWNGSDGYLLLKLRALISFSQNISLQAGDGIPKNKAPCFTTAEENIASLWWKHTIRTCYQAEGISLVSKRCSKLSSHRSAAILRERVFFL